jgi:hypothetical protein
VPTDVTQGLAPANMADKFLSVAGLICRITMQVSLADSVRPSKADPIWPCIVGKNAVYLQHL